jgi:DNA-binding MarR family transcriptional regulator
MRCPYTTSKRIINYIRNVLSVPSAEYGGLPPCPYVKAELDNKKLMLAELDPLQENLLNIIQEFSKSSYESLLIAQKMPIGESLTAKETGYYQKQVTRILKKMDMKEYKCICFNPNDKVGTVRQQAPYFLINIAHEQALSAAHKKIMKTDYFAYMSEEYVKFLHVDPKKVTRKVGS